jgi:hypothetical protein
VARHFTPEHATTSWSKSPLVALVGYGPIS